MVLSVCSCRIAPFVGRLFFTLTVTFQVNRLFQVSSTGLLALYLVFNLKYNFFVFVSRFIRPLDGMSAISFEVQLFSRSV